MQREPTGNILDCSNFVQFWLSWSDAGIRLRSNDTTYITYNDTGRQRSIRALSFTTPQDVSGVWEFPKDTGIVKIFYRGAPILILIPICTFYSNTAFSISPDRVGLLIHCDPVLLIMGIYSKNKI